MGSEADAAVSQICFALTEKKTIYSIRGSIEMTGPYMLNMELKPLFQITTIGKLPNCQMSSHTRIVPHPYQAIGPQE